MRDDVLNRFCRLYSLPLPDGGSNVSQNKTGTGASKSSYYILKGKVIIHYGVSCTPHFLCIPTEEVTTMSGLSVRIDICFVHIVGDMLRPHVPGVFAAQVRIFYRTTVNIICLSFDRVIQLWEMMRNRLMWGTKL